MRPLSPKRSCWTLSGKPSSNCAASGKRWNGFSTRSRPVNLCETSSVFTVEKGNGEPLIFVPGLQGRWEYMRPAFDALAETHRVITFPLCDEPAARAPFHREHGFDGYASHVESVLDALKIERAAICGISFGGLIALRFAATLPARASALVLASTPGPRFHLKKRHRLYARWPWLFGPVFAAESPSRLRAGGECGNPDRNGTTRVHAPADADVSRRTAVGHTHGEKGAANRIVRSSRGLRSGSLVRRSSYTENRHSIMSSTPTRRPATVTSSRAPASSCWSAPDICGSITDPRRFAEIVSGFLDDRAKGQPA